jgi:hypothetical protein
MDTGLAVAVLLAVAFAVTKGLHDASNAIATLVATRAASPLQGIGEELADASVIPADEVGRFSLVSKDLDDLAVTFVLPDVVTLDQCGRPPRLAVSSGPPSRSVRVARDRIPSAIGGRIGSPPGFTVWGNYVRTGCRHVRG